MFERKKERADQASLSAWQRRDVAIDVVRKMRVDAGHREIGATGKEHFRSGLNEGRLASMQDAESRRCLRIARKESLIADNDQCDEDEKEQRDH